MKLEIIDREKYVTSIWAGGVTNQLYICPTGLTVKDDFDFRISTAIVQNGSSEFTDFSNYERFLTVLKGSMFIKHDNKPEQCIERLQSCFFDGAVQTVSRTDQEVVDFNIIWKKGWVKPEIGITIDEHTVIVHGTMFIYACDAVRVCIDNKEQLFNQGQLLKITANDCVVVIMGTSVCCRLPIHI